jgi:hypothetical protein
MNFFLKFQENSRKIPGKFQENSRKIPGKFQENSRKIPGNFFTVIQPTVPPALKSYT